jgi:hypothetical protein
MRARPQTPPPVPPARRSSALAPVRLEDGGLWLARAVHHQARQVPVWRVARVVVAHHRAHQGPQVAQGPKVEAVDSALLKCLLWGGNVIWNSFH